MRRVHAYGVGLPRPGTHSIAGLLGRSLRSEHEPLAATTLREIRLWQQGKRTDETHRTFLLLRDRHLGFEVEASHFLVYSTPMLAELFPRARFVFTVREPASWLDSEMTQNLVTDALPGREWREYEEHRYSGRVRPGETPVLPANARLFPLQAYLRYWVDHCDRILKAVPPDRLLLVFTHELTQRVDEVARFVGVAPDTLDLSSKQLDSNEKRRRGDAAQEFGRDRVVQGIREICLPWIQAQLPALIPALAERGVA
ncbi:MAG: hypothetical protein FJ404_01860 [Verrucomicrobia bacterium]|nr:hypothetical protein [Verrucomicrobiota bacterium]